MYGVELKLLSRYWILSEAAELAIFHAASFICWEESSSVVCCCVAFWEVISAADCEASALPWDVSSPVSWVVSDVSPPSSSDIVLINVRLGPEECCLNFDRKFWRCYERVICECCGMLCSIERQCILLKYLSVSRDGGYNWGVGRSRSI